MPRLIDDLRVPGARVHMPHWVTPRREREWSEYALKLMEAANDPAMPVLLIDNVSEYFYSGTNQEHWSLDKDFPNIAPPFESFWVEYKMAKVIRSEAGDTDISQWLPQGGRVGQFFRALNRDEVNGESIPDNVRWIYWCDMFIDYHRPEVTADGPQGAMFLMVDAQGRGVGNPWILSYSAEGDEDAAQVLRSIMAWYNPTLLAISFLHCKNVAIVDHVVDKPLAKKWASRHEGQRPVNYKTLVIEPLKQVLRNQGRAHEHGLAKAMHICRGHFADYTQGRGLFGKYHGKFWIPSVVRGTRGDKAPAREIEIKISL